MIKTINNPMLIKKYNEFKAINESTEELKKDLKENSILGKNAFRSFTKVLAAVGAKDIKPNYDLCPQDYYIYYSFDNVDYDRILTVLERFKSLAFMINILKTNNKYNNYGFYIGIKYNKALFVEYGVNAGTTKHVAGEFRFGKNEFKSMQSGDIVILSHLKNELSLINYEDIITLMRAKMDLSKMTTGPVSTIKYVIAGNMLTVAYHGIGKWVHAEMENDELSRYKEIFQTWIKKQKWSDKITAELVAKNLWLYLKIRIKKTS